MLTPEQIALWAWADANQQARNIPLHLLAPVERQHSAVSFRPQGETHADVVRGILKEAEQELGSFAYRRRIEQHLANYLDHHSHANFELSELADKMRTCRTSGTVGYRETSRGEVRHVVAWDRKCNQVRLCPDEARVEQMRLAERYVPAMQGWKKEQKGRQIQYCVLTWPNVEPERLAEMKRKQFQHVARWLKRDVCSSIKGALAVQEDPLAADGDWNIHMNLLLLVQGRFDWSAARRDWFESTRALFEHRRRRADGRPYDDFQVYFSDIKDNQLLRSLLELVKYGAKHISGSLPMVEPCGCGAPHLREPGEDDEPSTGIEELDAPFSSSSGSAIALLECGRGEAVAPLAITKGATPDPVENIHVSSPETGKKTQAPGLTAWPVERFMEWWRAGKGFRRTRSYGKLYFRKDNPLFALVVAEEAARPSPEAVTWVGTVRWNRQAGAYQVEGSINLILADKFGLDRAGPTDNLAPGADPPPRW